LDQVPALIDNLEKFLETHKISYKNFKLEFQIKELTDIVNKYFSNVFNFLMNFFGGLISVILVFIVSIYVAFMKNFPEVYVKFFSFENEDEIIRLIRKIKLKVGFWLLGLIFLSFFIGISTYIFTGWVLDLKYAPTVSLAAGFFEILPVLGPIISLILGTAAVLVDKPEATLLVIGFFILLQQIENHFLVPLVMKKAISINPLFVIFSILIGGKIGGILGIITILPIVGIIVEVINYLKNAGWCNG
jgi:predicted PurR-regulated permease PerM